MNEQKVTQTKDNNACRIREQRSISSVKRSLVKLTRNKAALVGGILILIYVTSALLAPVLFRGNPSAPNLIKSLEPPSFENLLGTDELGRSIIGRILYGSRVSLLIAFGVVSVGMIIGIPFGLTLDNSDDSGRYISYL